MMSLPSRPWTSSEPALEQMTSALVVPVRLSSAAVPEIVHDGPAFTTLLMIPCANAGPTIRPTVATETKIPRSFTCRSSLSERIPNSPPRNYTRVAGAIPPESLESATSLQGGGVSPDFQVGADTCVEAQLQAE